MTKKQIKDTKSNKKLNIIQEVKWIFWTSVIMLIGLILFKHIPMAIWGKNILFDASRHVVCTALGLYILWFFVNKRKSWRTFYLIVSAITIIIMSIQRITVGEHNLIGVSLGILISAIAIIIPRWKEFKGGRK